MVRPGRRRATRPAPASAAPLDMPQKIPAPVARRRLAANASSSPTRTMPAATPGSQMGGTRDSLRFFSPWMRWPTPGSTAKTSPPGLAAARKRPRPTSVPPVPMPATTTSTSPRVWRQISGPVASRWAMTLARLANWSGMKRAAGSAATSAAARSMAPSVPRPAGVSSSSAPKAAMMARRSSEAQAGMTMRTRKPMAAPIMARAMPVLPEVASTMVMPGRSAPERTASRTMRSAGRSLTDPPGLLPSTLASTRVRGGSASRALTSTSGVLPIADRMSLMRPPCAWWSPGMGRKGRGWTFSGRRAARNRNSAGRARRRARGAECGWAVAS